MVCCIEMLVDSCCRVMMICNCWCYWLKVMLVFWCIICVRDCLFIVICLVYLVMLVWLLGVWVSLLVMWCRLWLFGSGR